MVRIFAIAAAIAVALVAPAVSAQTIINLPSVDIATGGAPASTTLTLAPGIYTATVIDKAEGGAYDGWNAATSTFPIYPTGIPTPAPGFYTEEYAITVGSMTTDVNGIHGPGSTPAGNVGPKYDSFAQALAGATTFTFAVTSAAPTVSFLIPDTLYSDNTGGVSLSIAAAAPEPATWAMMILGFAVIGLAMRRRKMATTKVSYAA